MIFDDVDRHLADSQTFERAAAVPGLFLAWCVNLGLVSETLGRDAETTIVRVKYREITGGELLVSACGGELAASALSESGRRFAERHYADYLAALPSLAGVETLAEVDDKWTTYDKVAPWLTERYLGRAEGRGHKAAGAGTKKPWWRFWS